MIGLNNKYRLVLLPTLILRRGKSGGVRTIVAFKADKNTFFVYGFAKNVQANISPQEETALKKLAKVYFGFSDKDLAQAVDAGQLFEVS